MSDVRRKRIPAPRRQRVNRPLISPPPFPRFGEDLLRANPNATQDDPDSFYYIVDDVREEVLLKNLVLEASGDVRAHIAVILLAQVCKDLDTKLRAHVRALEVQNDMVPVYCRALFEYMRDASTFELFMERLLCAPAVRAAWAFLLKHDKQLTREFGDMVADIRREQPLHYHAALDDNGRDPIATALCLHHMARPGAARFSATSLAKLAPLVMNQLWASWFLGPCNFGRCEWSDVLRICSLHCDIELHNEADAARRENFFLSLLSQFTGRVSGFQCLPPKRLLRRIARLNAGSLPLKVVCFGLRHRAGETQDLESDVVFIREWVKDRLVDLTSVGAVLAVMESAATLLKTCDTDSPRVTVLREVLAHLARKRAAVDVIIGVVQTLPERGAATSTAISTTIEMAVYYGYHDLLRACLDRLQPLNKQSLRDLLCLCSIDVRVVAGRDIDGLSQKILRNAFFGHPAFVEPCWWRRPGICLTDELTAALERHLAPEKHDEAFWIRQANMLYHVVSLKTTSAMSILAAAGLDPDSEFDDEEDDECLYRAAYIACQMARYKPDATRIIMTEVLRRLTVMFDGEQRAKDAVSISQDLCELGAKSLHHFVRSPIFRKFLDSQSKANNVNRLDTNIQRLLTTSPHLAFMQFIASTLSREFWLQFVRYSIVFSRFERGDFVINNLVFWAIALPEYSTISTHFVSSHKQWNTAYLAASSVMQGVMNLYHPLDQVDNIEALERLYKATHKFL